MNVTISIPGDGSALRGTVPVTVDARPTKNVRKVDLYANDQLVGTGSGIPAEFPWNTTSGPDGQYVLRADVTYKQRVSTATITVWVANTAPAPEPPPPEPSPPGDKLTLIPPGYNGGDPREPSSYPGYTVVQAATYEILHLDSSKDYVIVVDRIVGSGSSGSTRFGISGGRNVVACGGEIDFSQNGPDDAHAFMIDGGDPAGTVHIEGVGIPRGVNGFTVRTGRRIQLANVHATCRSLYSGPHPDLIQVWRGHRSRGIFIDGFTGASDFTYFSDLTDITTPYGIHAPQVWALRRVDLHPVEGKGLNHWMGDPSVCVWEGEAWLETSVEPTGNRRDLGDQCRQHGEQYAPKHAAYQILDESGNVIYQQPAGIASGAPGDAGRLQGHSLRYHENPRLANMTWRCQLPPGGPFVTTAGREYVSPGYVSG